MGRALLLGVAELLGRLDVLAGRRLLYVAEVRRQPSGDWLVERYELTGEIGPAARVARTCPRPRRPRVCRGPSGSTSHRRPIRAAGACVSLHPLVLYDARGRQVFFLNARRGKRRTEYLCYTTAASVERADLDAEQRELLAGCWGWRSTARQVEAWAARSQAEEPPARRRGRTRRPRGRSASSSC